MSQTTAIFLFGVAMFGIGALITGLFWAAAHSRLVEDHAEAILDRDLWQVRARDLTRAHEGCIADYQRAGINGATRAHLRRVK